MEDLDLDFHSDRQDMEEVDSDGQYLDLDLDYLDLEYLDSEEVDPDGQDMDLDMDLVIEDQQAQDSRYEELARIICHLIVIH